MTQHYLLSWLIPLLWLVILSYAVFTFILTFFWNRIKPSGIFKFDKRIFISVIIPVRNEADNIGLLLNDLDKQHFPHEQFEVLIMDDNSTDRTAAIVQALAANSQVNLHLIALPGTATTSPKKRAIETAVARAKGNLIVTTDGDCRVESGWLQSIAACYAATNAKLISAPVTFADEKSVTDHLQTVEFASLIGSGGSAIGAGYPSLCNGANLAYEKSAFIEVGGFEGVRHIASGDDEFLMHKIADRYPDGVHFLKDARAIVTTKAHDNWQAFFGQRKRWASKWKHYQSKTPLFLAIYIFTCNLSLIISGLLYAVGLVDGYVFLSLLSAKCLPEWLFLGSVLSFLKKPGSIPYIPITQIIYPFYVCFFGLAAQNPAYEWKGRKLV
ncbi:glycosyltransferase [Dyadobacter chenwenxiniae]|uniref:Glycosyltransferase n=1 Tax=Dyadobacter chenwenxiniae TaxID=2906456 RepID=A0A9X1TF64_9BACT|nr:glycosyltransferase [Dyadobacter chenwenxiniae]MCF0062290.1 glycosyltransferase [Dyadobacter chenwenxiniae]UON83954.1 glycosyltransferase [Dyadobacter chenwenxiniae]